MKKCTLLFLMLSGMASFAQTKSTGDVDFGGGVIAKLDLDAGSSEVTLTLTGPSDRWFAIGYGNFTGAGMAAGNDLVYWNNTTLVEADFNGTGAPAMTDVTNNWTQVSVTPNATSGNTTLVFKRAFNTGDATDYVFNFADADIDLVWGKRGSAGYVLGSHGNAAAGNRGLKLDIPLSATLGTPDFTLNATTVAPVPAKDMVTLKTTTSLEKINIYSQTGALIKTQVVNSLDATEVQVKDLATGIYLLELVNPKDNAWKKIVIE
jgi:hypothetical protein